MAKKQRSEKQEAGLSFGLLRKETIKYLLNPFAPSCPELTAVRRVCRLRHVMIHSVCVIW